MKILGKEWSAFLKALPDCFYFEDDESPTDYKPDEVVEVRWGCIAWQGPRAVADFTKYAVDGVISARQVRSLIEDGETLSLLGTFKRWQKLQNVDHVAVEVPRDKRGELEEAVRRLGGRVVK